MSISTPRRSSRNFALLLVVGLFVVLATVAWFVTVAIANAPYQRAAGEARDAPIPEDHPLLQASYFDLLLPEPSENRNAMNLITGAAAALDQRQLNFPPDFPRNPGDLEEAELRDALATPGITDAIEILHQITPEHVFWVPPPADLADALNRPRPHLSEFRAPAQLLSWSVIAQAQLGNFSEAHRSAEALVLWASLQSPDPDTLGYLVSVAIRAIAANTLQELLAIEGVNSDSVARYDRQMQSLYLRHQITRATKGEYQLAHHSLATTGALTRMEMERAYEEKEWRFPIPIYRRQAMQDAYQHRFFLYMAQAYSAAVAWESQAPDAAFQLESLRQERQRIEAADDRADDFTTYFGAPPGGGLFIYLRGYLLECLSLQGVEFMNHMLSGAIPRIRPEDFFASCETFDDMFSIETELENGVLTVTYPSDSTAFSNSSSFTAFRARLDNSPDPRAQAYWSWLAAQKD